MRNVAFLGIAAALAAGPAQAMTYSLLPFQDGTMGILAQGRIEGNESARLASVLQQAGGAARMLVISSPGGDMASAIDLGQTLRHYGIQTVVGALGQDAYGQRALGAGRCHSACVLVLMAGVQRSIMPGSRVGVHAPSVVMVQGGRTYALDDATTRYMVQGTEPVLRSYARQMGVSPQLIDVAHRTPHTSIRTLTGSELARFGLVTSGRASFAKSPGPRKRSATGRRANRLG